MKIGIIGGGLSGTIACKYALERGHTPIIFEKTNQIGGVYSLLYDKKNYKLSSSKYITSFTDHLPSKENNIWMDIEEFQNYIGSYIEKFNLLKYFKFNCQIKNLKYFKTHVLLFYENNLGEINVEKFDKIIISTGLNQNPKYKEINGLDSFQGTKIHTHDVYTNSNYDPKKFFKGKNILIVGGGESSFDIGHEAVKYGKKIYLHTDNDVEWFPEGALEVDEKTGKRYDKCFKDMNRIYHGKGNSNYFVNNNDETSAPNDTILTRNEYSFNPLYSEIWQNNIAREIAPGNYQKR